MTLREEYETCTCDTCEFYNHLAREAAAICERLSPEAFTYGKPELISSLCWHYFGALGWQ